MHNRRLCKISLLLCVGFLWIQSISGQTTFVIDEIPQNTPSEDQIYISGDFEGWTGGQEAYQLEKHEGFYSFIFPNSDKSINYKFTRGNWTSVEVANDGSQIDNRTYSFLKEKDTVFIQIQKWDDLSVAPNTVSNNVHLVNTSFKMSPLDKERAIYIYLPKNYENSAKRYPVLYMQDGQNLFDQSRSYSGEWEVDETLDRLGTSHDLELIVVGIDHGGSERIDEYTPWELKEYSSKKEGDAYVQFLVNTLKPFVDTNYRTLSDRTNTGIMGSSMGGLISFYATLKYPETFGKAGVFSPSFELVNSDEFTKMNSNLKDSQIYFMAGLEESEHMVNRVKETCDIMKKSGFPTENIKSQEVEGGQHNEKLWRDEFAEAVIWLF